MSFVTTYRSQFNRIIQTSLFGDLMRRIREKETGAARQQQQAGK